MDADKLRAEIDRLGPWLHAIEIAPGVSTATVGQAGGSGDEAVLQANSPEQLMRRLIGSIYPGGMGGRSFLDCGCNAGGHMFAAAALGAGRCFGFDARRHWIDQARFVAQHLPCADVDFATCALSDLPGLELEPFDVTLFKGLFYHLPDPVAGLKIAADLTRELIVVNTSVLPRPEKALMLSVESDSHILSGVDRLAWLPTGSEVVQDILAWCGFPHSRVDMDWLPPGPPGWRRIQLLAARDAQLFTHYDKVRPDAARAVGRRGRPGPIRRLARRLAAPLRR
jgi:tRNA (mo5U34)-methyltransferase